MCLESAVPNAAELDTSRYLEGVLQVEKIALVESVQRGMRTPAFEQGRIVVDRAGSVCRNTRPARWLRRYRPQRRYRHQRRTLRRSAIRGLHSINWLKWTDHRPSADRRTIYRGAHMTDTDQFAHITVLTIT